MSKKSIRSALKILEKLYPEDTRVWRAEIEIASLEHDYYWLRELVRWQKELISCYKLDKFDKVDIIMKKIRETEKEINFDREI